LIPEEKGQCLEIQGISELLPAIFGILFLGISFGIDWVV
jgi:hypothetical protein